MGLSKLYLFNGVPCTYARIIGIRSEINRGLTEATLGLYYNQDVRRANPDSFVTAVPFTFYQLDLTREDIYRRIVAPRPGINVAADGVTEIPVEKNEWHDAVAVWEEGQPGWVNTTIAPPIVKAVSKPKKKPKK